MHRAIDEELRALLVAEPRKAHVAKKHLGVCVSGSGAGVSRGMRPKSTFAKSLEEYRMKERGIAMPT